MPDLATPAALQKILADHVGNLSRCLTGVAGYGQRILLTALEDATNYANTLGNKDTTNGRAVKIQYGDQSGLPVTLATFQKSSSRIQSNDGTDYVDISNSGVAVTGAFSINGQTVGAGIRVYNVLDHGLVTGGDSTNAAANTTALVALWSTVSAAGGGVIYFPPGTYPINATSFNHATGSAKSISLHGSPGLTTIKVYGSAGPFLDIANATASALIRCGLKDLTILHGTAVGTATKGPTMRLGCVSQYRLENVRIMADTNGATHYSPDTCLQIGGTGDAINGLELIDCKFQTRTDYSVILANGLTPICVDVAANAAGAGLKLLNCELDGAYDTSATPDEGYSIGLRFSNSADWDTVLVGQGCVIKDHKVAILKSAGAGNVENVTIIGATLDFCEDANIQLEPPSGADVANWLIVGTWMSALTRNIVANESGSGVVEKIAFVGCYMTNATTSAVTIGAGVDDKILVGNLIPSSVSGVGNSVVEIGTASAGLNLVAVGNIVKAAASTADASIEVGSGEDAVAVVGNVSRVEDISFGPSVDATAASTGNAFLA